MNNDLTLLREYARGNSEEAFAALVSRHVNLVYSVTLRQVRDPQLAEEITQAVFIILARKAGSLGPKTILSGWLCRTARYASANALTIQRRRQRREQEAHMQSILNEATNEPAETWTQIAPLLDGAMEKLGQKDHDAVVLRFFEGRNFKEVGAALGASEDAAKMRVNRALEKLRQFFTKRGVSSTTAIIAGAMVANSVQAAPVALAKSVTVVAIAKGVAASGSTLILVKGALKLLAWAKAKTAIVIGGVLLGAGIAVVAIDDSFFELNGETLAKAPDNLVIIRPTHFAKSGGSGMVGGDGRIVGQNYSIEGLIMIAYQFSITRMVLPTNLPEGGFDYLITLPDDHKSSGDEEVRRAIRDEIKMQFGLVAHKETRELDVLLLRVGNSSTSGFKPKAEDSMKPSPVTSSVERFSSKNCSMSGLAYDLEARLGMPVLDQTDLTYHYDIDLRWDKRPGETQLDTTKRVVLDQLGLELVLSREPIKMLVVEKAQ